MSAPLSNWKSPVGVSSNMAPVARERLHDRITRDIALSIIRGNIGKDPPPDLLTETDLSRNLQVSRTALRESVKVLAAKGLIEVRPKIGITVKPREDWNILDPDLLAWLCEAGLEDLLVRDLCEARMLIEPAAAELAAIRATEEETEELLACYRQMEANPLNRDVYDAADRQFHVKIFDSCHNALIRNMKAMITESLRAIQNMTLKFHSRFADKSLHLHGHVAEAIQKRNPGEARKFMERIVKQAADDISTVLAINVAQFADLSEGRSSSLGRLGKNPFAPPALRGLRRLGRKELEERRLQAVHLVESGQSPESVARHLGLNRTTVYDWLAHYRSRGEAGLTSRPIPGRPKKLTVRQLQSLRENLSKAPRDFGFKEPLWNLAAVRDLIRREFDVPLSSGSVRRLLAELGLDCKRPLKEILERDPVRSRSWLKSEYPRLKALCRDQGAELFFEKPLAGTSPDGGKPMQAREEIRDTPSRFFCAVTSKGTAQFIGLTDTLTPVQYLSFLTAFTTGLRGLAYLVASPGALHEDAQVLSFLERNEERVRLIALPV